MGLSNKLSCEAGSFSHHLNPHRFFQSDDLRLYCPMLEPWVVWSVLLPSCSSPFICTRMWDRPPATTLLQVLSAWLPFSTSPTGLDECFFFKSLVVGLPYNLTFWLFLFLNWLLSFWLSEEAQCVYLCLDVGQKFYFYFQLFPFYLLTWYFTFSI